LASKRALSAILKSMLHPNFAILGALLNGVGGTLYLIETIKGRVKPNRMSFLLWAIVPMIAFAAQRSQGVGIESIMTFSAGFIPFIIFLASFVNKKAEWQLTAFDLWCGFFSVVGITLWLTTKVGNMAIFFSIVADGLAALPTVVKAYQAPETENAWLWLTGVLGVIVTLLTLDRPTFANSAFIIYILVVNALIFSLVYFELGKKLSGVVDKQV